MSNEALFHTLTAADIAGFIESAERAVCYAGPGIQEEVARALLAVMPRVGPEMLTVCLDFDERVIRMGYGSFDAVSLLRDAGIMVRNAPGLRMALVIADRAGYLFTPTPLYLEADPAPGAASNAMRMSGAQVDEALARLSPAAKAIAVAQAATPEERQRIAALPVDVGSEQVTDREEELQQHLDGSRQQVVEYYIPRVLDNPPDALAGRLLEAPTAEDAKRWLDGELNRVFPTAEALIDEMRLEVRFKDVTYETLKREDFLKSVKEAFPHIDWDRPYDEFKAAAGGGGPGRAGSAVRG